MAVYWVDPYVGTGFGGTSRTGVHGTTDIVTRDGSYAAPWLLNDISTTADTIQPTVFAALSSGDEIRIKGLPAATFLTPLPNTFWYLVTTSNYFDNIQSTNADDSALLDPVVGKPFFLWINPTSGTFGDDNVILIGNSFSKPTGLYYRLSGSYSWGYTQAGFSCLGYAVNNGGSSFVNWYDYDIDYPATLGYSTFFLFTRLPVGVTVTSGWTSETVRDGYTFLIDRNNASAEYFNFCVTSSTYLSACGAFDCPELYILIASTSGSRHQPQIGGGGAGTSNAIGGVVVAYTLYSPEFYPTKGADLTIDYINVGNSPSMGSVRGSGTAFATVYIKNLLLSYSPYVTATASYVKYKFKNIHGGSFFSASNAYIIQPVSNGTAASSPEYEFVGGGKLTTARFNCSAVLRYFVPFSKLTVGAGISNAYSGVFTNNNGTAIVGQNPLLAFGTIAGTSLSNIASFKINPTTFSDYFFPQTDFYGNDGSYYMATADTEGQNYKTLTDTPVVDLSLLTINSDVVRNYVFQTNTYDGRPLMYVVSADDKVCMLYTNSSNGALVFHQFSSSSGSYFQKDLAVDFPSYGSSSVQVTVVYDTSSAFDGALSVALIGINKNTGAKIILDSGNVIGGGTTDGSIVFTATNLDLVSNDIKNVFLRCGLTSGATGAETVSVKSITAVTV